MTNEIYSFSHVGITTDKEVETMKFYTEVLGLKAYSGTTSRKGVKKFMLYSGDNYILEIFAYRKGTLKANINGIKTGVDHIAFYPENITWIWDRIIKKNINVTDLRTDKNNGKRYFFVYDPNEVKLEFYERQLS